MELITMSGIFIYDVQLQDNQLNGLWNPEVQCKFAIIIREFTMELITMSAIFINDVHLQIF